MFTEAVLLTPFARSTKMTARIDAMTPPAETETAEGSALPAPPDAAITDEAGSNSPSAVQIVSVGTEEDKYAFTFHEDRLNSVLAKVPPGWKVSVISVVGAFRTGKSFLLTWFLRYLRYHGTCDPALAMDADADAGKGEASDSEKWYNQFEAMGQAEGFNWRGGAERNTTGIWMWSDPHFIRRTSPATGEREDVAVILVDTQGMFDNETTMSLTASIFGLSTLLSSYQVYNVDKRIQEDNLQQLALFSEYGRMALQNDEKDKGADGGTAGGADGEEDIPAEQPKPFQRIDFLVRDWQNFDEEEDLDAMEFEMDEYLAEVLAEREADDLKETREQISDCFESVTCFMLTHPGFAVTKKTYSGEVSKMEPTFLRLLDRYCERVFKRGENVVPKAIRGKELTAVELGAYVKAYAQMFETGARFPEASTMLEATAHANNTNATTQTVQEYKGKMDRIAGPSVTSFLREEELEEMHRVAVEECLAHFDDVATFGNQRGIDQARENTLRSIGEDYTMYRKLNESRNPLAGMGIYIIPGGIAVCSSTMRWTVDWTCSHWSSTCRAGSEFLSHIIMIIFFFMLIIAATKAKQIKEAIDRVVTAMSALNGNSGGSAGTGSKKNR